MSKLTCGDCYGKFESEDHWHAGESVWICPHCDTVLQEGEL